MLAPILLPAECRDRGAAWDALLFPRVGAEMHFSGRPPEHLYTTAFVPVQIAGCSWKSRVGKVINIFSSEGEGSKMSIKSFENTCRPPRIGRKKTPLSLTNV